MNSKFFGSRAVALATFFLPFFSFAQPANDNCATAQVVTIPASGQVCINTTNATATSDNTTNACDNGAAGNEIWFTYIATGADNVITATPSGASPATAMVVTMQSTACGSATYNHCGSATGAGTATSSFTYPVGTQVWVSVETNGTNGTFTICFNSTTPPAGTGASCATATRICNKNMFSVPTFPNNNNAFSPSCFGDIFGPASLQRPIFYQFTVGQTGTCEWAANPYAGAELDWAMYDITNGCPGTEIACNYNYNGAAGNPCGMSSVQSTTCPTNGGSAALAAEFCPPVTVTVGRTYVIILDNYTDNNTGYDFTWGGTFLMAPTAAYTATPTSGCAPLNVSFTNSSIAATSYDWDFGNGNGSTSATPGGQTYNTPGTYLTSLTVTSASGCTNTTSQAIVVNPSPVMNPISNQTHCAGAAVPATPFSSATTGVTYSWTNSNTGIGLGGSGSGTSLPGFTATNAGSTPITATITVTPSASGCNGTPVVFTITINPRPTMTAPANVTVCAGATVPASAFSSTPAGATFNWTNSNTNIGLAGSGVNNYGAFTATNATTGPITGTITVTPAIGTCTGTPVNYTITVNPTPTMTAPANVTVCAGATVPASAFTSTPTGATFNWSNSNTNIGLGASGTNNYGAFTGTNTTGAPITGTITVTPSIGTCSGTPVNYTITVNPTPTMTAPANVTVCAGATVPASAFTSTPAGANFSWTNSNTTIGLGGSGTNNYGSFTGTNGTGSPISGTITVTPSFGTCNGTPVNYTITINPVPTMTTPANVTVCAGATVPASAFNSTPTGATFNWTNSNTNIGLGASGSNNYGAFTGTNATAAPISGTITVTPSFGTCTGTPVNYTITINPLPSMTAPANVTVCAGATVPASAFSSTPPGATFSWTNSNTNIGLGGSGVSNYSSFTGTNATSAPITGTITVTPAFGTCTGTPVNYTITVNPSPTMTAPANVTVCAGATVPASAFTSTPAGAGFSWTNSNTNIGLGASGTNNYGAFTGTNSGTAPITGTITVTPAFGTCSGPPVNYTITVNPVPVISPVADITECTGQTISGSGFVVTPAGANVTWTNSNTNIGLGASGNGDYASFTATNPGAGAITGTITVSASLAGCNAVQETYTITVGNTPTMTDPTDITVCAGDNVPASAFASTPTGASFSWTNNNTGTGLGASGNNNTPSFTATNAGTTAIVSTVTVTPAFGSCVGTPQSYTITVNPVPVINPVADVTACEGDNVAGSAFGSTPAGATFSWTNSNTSIGLGASGTNDYAAFTAGNPGTGSITATITVNATLAGCDATPETYTITIGQTPTMTTPTNVTVCAGDNVPASAFASSPTGASFSWTNDNTGTGLGASGNGDYAAFTATNAGTTAITSTITVTPAFGTCVGTPVNYTITVNPIPVIDPVADVTACEGDNIAGSAFNVTPAAATFNWDNDNTTIGLGASGNGDYAAFTAGDPGAGSITATITVNATLAGCDAAPEIYTITVGQTPTMTAPANVTVCAGANVPASAFASTPTGASFSWTNDNTGIGLGASGNGNYAAFTSTNAGTTAITSTITVTPSFGTCVGTPESYTITVNPIPTATAANNGPLCTGDALNLTSGAFTGATYSWSGPGTFSSTDQNPVIDPVQLTDAGTYTVTVTASGCSSTASTTVVINTATAAVITPAGPFCNNEPPVYLTSTIPGGTWSGPGIIDAATGQFDPSAANSGANNITYTPNQPCSAPGTITITVNPVPTVQFVADNLTGCAPLTVTFTDQSSPASGSVLWDFGDGTTSTQTGSVSHTFNGIGCYTISLTSTTNGCSATQSVPIYICVLPNANAAFTATPTIQTETNPVFQFTNESTNATSYSWDFGDGTTSTAEHPNHTYPAEAGSYTVTLTATNPGGCSDVATLTVQIREELVFFVPNAFTPDGDAYNNTFHAVFSSGFDPYSYTMLIFDRWGEIVFESNDVNGEWDGTYAGQLVKEGVYTWTIRFRDSQNDKKYEYNGTVTILK